MTGIGGDYKGFQTYTRSGRLCQEWPALEQDGPAAPVVSTALPGCTEDYYAWTRTPKTAPCKNCCRWNLARAATGLGCDTADAAQPWEACEPLAPERIFLANAKSSSRDETADTNKDSKTVKVYEATNAAKVFDVYSGDSTNGTCF